MSKISSIWPLFLRLKRKRFFSILKPGTLRKSMLFGTFRYTGFWALKQGFHLFTFSEKPNGISMILSHFWALFACDVRTDARTEDKPAQRDPLHALGTHPVCGRRPPTPI